MYNEDFEMMMKKYANKKLTRSVAIKLYCKYSCCAGDLVSWGNCTFYACPLWKFRRGKETLGNQTSFKKQRKHTLILTKNSIPQAVAGVQDA